MESDLKKNPESEVPLSFDARDWANAFAKTLEKRPNLHLDQECMFTWFANAIMAGFDESNRRLKIQVDLIQWLQSGKYRVLMQRHDGTFRAVDEAFNVSWQSDSLQELLEMLNNPKYQPVEKAP